MLARSISDVLDIARLTQGVFALTPVAMNIKEVVHNVVGAFAHRSTLFTIQGLKEVTLSADPQRVQQVLETMLLYLLSSSTQPREITIDVSTEKRADGPWVLLSCQASGLAMPHMSGNLLQPFVVNAHSLQLGVQLYLAGQIAQAHGGTFTIHSVADKGTWLTLALPVEEEELIISGDDENKDAHS